MSWACRRSRYSKRRVLPPSAKGGAASQRRADSGDLAAAAQLTAGVVRVPGACDHGDGTKQGEDDDHAETVETPGQRDLTTS